jgi:hypothetical protein
VTKVGITDHRHPDYRCQPPTAASVVRSHAARIVFHGEDCEGDRGGAVPTGAQRPWSGDLVSWREASERCAVSSFQLPVGWFERDVVFTTGWAGLDTSITKRCESAARVERERRTQLDLVVHPQLSRQPRPDPVPFVMILETGCFVEWRPPACARMVGPIPSSAGGNREAV